METRVPIKYGDMSRQVAAILNNNTENITLSVPALSGYITSLDLASDYRVDPSLVTKAQLTEQEFDHTTSGYNNKQGNSYTVERYMPVPYEMKMRLDILSSNTDSKLQILEQLLTIFNPSIQLQQNENVADWSRVFEVELTNITWSNRSIPVGSEVPYDISTLDFSIKHVMINPAAKEKRQRIIKSVVTRIHDTDELPDDWDNPFSNEIARQVVTSDNLHLDITRLSSGEYSGKLLSAHGVDNGRTWKDELDRVGDIIPDHTRLKIRLADDIDDESGDVFATVHGIDINDPSVIIFSFDQDSLPATISHSPVNSIIDPLVTYDGNGIDLSIGNNHKYIVHGDDNGAIINTHNAHFGGIEAYNGDIISNVGGSWTVVFRAIDANNGAVVHNLADGSHYTLVDEEWVYTVQGTVMPGYWSLLDIKI